MNLMDKTKKTMLGTLTEQTSPFKQTKKQQLFQNAANLQLWGNTFDAVHLDKFLHGHNGDRLIKEHSISKM